MRIEDWKEHPRRVLVWEGILFEELDPLSDECLLLEHLLTEFSQNEKTCIFELLNRAVS